jgi:hypothetical protein
VLGLMARLARKVHPVHQAMPECQDRQGLQARQGHEDRA